MARRCSWFAGALLFAVGHALGFGPLLVSGQAAAQPVDVAIKAAYTPTTAVLTAFVAKDEGIFQKHGLDVTLIPTQNSSMLPGTLGKQVDIAFSTPPDLLKSAASGLDVAMICAASIETGANHNVELIVRKNSGITTIADLKGRIVATPTIGAVIHVATLYWLRKSGVDVNSIRAVEVPFPNMADQLTSKRVDAVETVQPFAGQLLESGNNATLGDPTLQVSDPALQTMWIAQGAWARANPNVVAAWTASIRSAIDFIKQNPAEARTVLGRYTHLPAAVVERIPIPVYETSVSPAQLDVWIKVLLEMGQLSEPMRPEKLIINGG